MADSGIAKKVARLATKSTTALEASTYIKDLVDVKESGKEKVGISILADPSFGIRDSFTLVNCKLLDTSLLEDEGLEDDQWEDDAFGEQGQGFIFVGTVKTKTSDGR
jgi:predicted nuclease of restriction endonuclease-like (RecB) superfamily